MTCFAPDCTHNFSNSGCKLLRFPYEYKERREWIKAIRRLDKQPNESTRICSCHFVDGKRENGPTIFSWNSKKPLKPIIKSKRKKPKPKSKNTSTSSSSNTELNSYISDDEDVPVYTNVDEENTALRNQIRNLRMKIEKMKKQPFGMHRIENDTRLFSYYTGLTKQSFDTILDLCSKSELRYFCGWQVDNFDLRDQLLITLMKLRLNLEYLDLAVRFNTTEDTINNVVLTFVSTLHQILYVNKMNELPAEKNNPASRMIVGFPEFDTVIPLQTNGEEDKPPSKKYKNTLKGLIATDTNGTIVHYSQLYSDSAANKVIMRRSGIANRFPNTRLIPIDEGPVPNDGSLTDDFEAHVRSIERLRDFSILNFVPKPLFMHASKIFQLCGALTNLSNTELKRIVESSNEIIKEEIEVCDTDPNDTFISCVKTEFEEVTYDVELQDVNCGDFDTVSCKNELEYDENFVEFNIDLEDM